MVIDTIKMGGVLFVLLLFYLLSLAVLRLGSNHYIQKLKVVSGLSGYISIDNGYNCGVWGILSCQNMLFAPS